jgi:two-component system, LuxR family, sensor kinase FixL
MQIGIAEQLRFWDVAIMDLKVMDSDEHQIANRSRHARRLTFLIVIVTVAILASLWLVVLQQTSFEASKAQLAAVRKNEDRALMLQQYVSRTLDAADIAALHILELSRTRTLNVGLPRAPSTIAGEIVRNPAFLGVSIANADGDVVASTLGKADKTGNVREHPAFAAHVSQNLGRLFVSKPASSRILGQPTIWLSRRINQEDGNFAGVVAINMAPDQLTAVFGDTIVNPSETAWVAGLDGIIRSRRTDGTVSSGEDISRGVLFAAQKRVSQGSFVGPGTLDGRMRLVSHRRVPGYPLFVSYSILRDNLLREARRRAALFLAGAGIATLVAILLAALLINALRNRERRARELAVAKARLEEAQRIARIGDWAFSFSDRKVSWSPQLFELYDRDLSLGPPSDEEFQSWLEDEAPHIDPVAQLIASGEPVSWQVKVRLPTGRVAYHLISAVPTRDGNGEIIGLHGTTQDVSEGKKLELLQSDLAHLSRVGAMNALAATISHELNQPLTAASNYLSAGRHMVEHSADPKAESTTAMLVEAQRQVTRTGEIIQRMRNLIAKNASSRAVTLIDDVIGEALVAVHITRICLKRPNVVDAGQELFVLVDTVQIQQVILNLVRNACEAQNAIDAAPPTISSTLQGNNLVVVSVTDCGPGFPEELSKRLFEPFVSLKESGLGLGLSISRTIIEAHGGSMKACNNPGGGASVSFSLPLHSRRPRPI